MKRHCDLCDHQKLSLQKGDLCGLTNQKPEFNRTCTTIDFGNNLLDILEDILVDLEELKNTKKKVYKNVVSGSIVGVFLLICGYIIFDYFYNNELKAIILKFDKSSVDSIGFLIIVSGSVLITGYHYLKKAINNFSNHKNQLISLENYKLEIDEVLSLYNQKYKYKITFDKEVHGTQEIDIEIELT
ncbi:hypothetical protein [Polaribacter sp. Z022]|uniref:hypothetical protein n=1 Tax=Polaribacter sp. Z022 TaxID=2927125 RepID=UPI002021C4AC|nr:hypothetical protein [Polaribacter sp. Z022]MCL7752558.1 hypothetical protein [Polaribacter sp. Z022]